ncbi:MAG: phage holin family protein [Anaerolineaceae bacterium]
MRFFIRWFITTIAVAAAAWITPGFTREGNWWVAAIITALILGLVNALIRPVMKFLSCGLIIVTLGLFTLVINALCLWLASYISWELFGIGFKVDNFGSAFIGSIIISVVSFLLSFLLPDKDNKVKIENK